MGNFLSLVGILYVIGNSGNYKGKTLEEHILKDRVPHNFDARVAEIQKEHHQQATQLKQTITVCDNRIQAIQYKSVCLQSEIRAKHQKLAALRRRYVDYLANEDKNNGITIIAKSNKAAQYTYVSICAWHG